MVKRGTNYLGPPLKVLRVKDSSQGWDESKIHFWFSENLEKSNYLLEKLHPKNIKFLQKVEGMFIL